MLRVFYLLVFSFVLLLAAGCTLLAPVKETPPVLYDLCQSNEVSREKIPVETAAFSDLTGNGTRMAVREKEGALRLESAYRFTVSPAQLLRRKLALYFAGSSAGNAETVLTGTLLRFEYCPGAKEVHMIISYTLRSGKRTEGLLHDVRAKVTKETPAARAAAFEEAILISARRLAGEIRAWQKQLK